MTRVTAVHPSMTRPAAPPSVRAPVEVRIDRARPVQGAPSAISVYAGGAAWWRRAFPGNLWFWLAGLLIAVGWDRAVWLGVSAHTMPTLERIEAMTVRSVWGSLASLTLGGLADAAGAVVYHAIKFCGTVWAAAAIAAVLVMAPFFQPDVARVRRGVRRGTLVFLCSAFAGLAAEILKLIFRRQRPELSDGWYAFRTTDFWSSSGLGLPSSHAAPAVALAIALGAVFPKWRVLFVALAALCCLSRILAGAHYLSDVLVGVLIGLFVARAITALDLRNNRGEPVAVPG